VVFRLDELQKDLQLDFRILLRWEGCKFQGHRPISIVLAEDNTSSDCTS
jgi:hypothetical protein